jgi:hypothetical protein
VLGLPVNFAAWFAGRGLASMTVEEYLTRTKAESTPKPTDWVLTPNKAEPVTPRPTRPTPREDDSPKHTTPTVREADRPKHTTICSNPTQEKARTAMISTNGTSNGYAHIPVVHASGDPSAHFEATTRLLLETQQTLSRVLERFLESQERILLHSAPSVLPAAGMAPPLPEMSAPAPVAEVVPSAPAVRPSRIRAMPGRPAASTNGSHPTARLVMPPVSSPMPERSSVAPPHPPKPRSTTPTRVEKPAAPVSAPSPVAAPATSENAPSAEQFRQDLLEVVSTRTGYPIDALDENLNLESGLGIDSIKTVEIFSKLKPYHKYFRAEGEGEEELLTEFTKMKTLRDIVNSYDRRRQDYLAKNGTAAADRSPVNGVNGAVKRYEVTPVAAPLHVNGSKKNYLTGNYSS